MKDRLLNAIKGKNAYVEVRIERKETSRVQFRGRMIDELSANTDLGGFVRALVPNGGWGIATFNRIEELERRINEAIELSRSIIPPEPIRLTPVEIVQVVLKENLKDDFRNYSLVQKKELIENYNEILLGYNSAIVDTSATYYDSFSKLYYANTDGTYVEKERADCGIMLVAVARQNGNIQQAHEGRTSRVAFSDLKGLEELAKGTAEKAFQLLSAETVKGGRYTVVLDPYLAGVFIHEAFGHLSEADHVYENPRAMEMMKLGKKFGPPELNVGDDGAIPSLRGSIYYDDEGTPARRNYLIKEGILVGRLHSRETASKMNETPTGNARAQSYNHPPIVRMTNTFIENGNVPVEDIFSDIKEGIYACRAYGGMTQFENFSFSAGYAYIIRNGRVENLVRDVVLQGNLFETLLNIEAIGNDFIWLPTGGTCGKDGQLAPVGMGSPHIRIRNVLIGGK